MAHRQIWIQVATWAVLLVLAAACSATSPVVAPRTTAPTAAPTTTAPTTAPATTERPAPTALPVPTAAPVPRFEPADAALQALVGTTFVGDLPPAMQSTASTARSAGAAIVNAAADPAETERVGMHWAVTAEGGDFIVTDWAGFTDDGTPRWTVRSAWRLVLGPGMVVTFGTNVCEAPPGSFDDAGGDFVAVTNEEQDRALGAWTVTSAGPQVYTELEALDCERFTP